MPILHTEDILQMAHLSKRKGTNYSVTLLWDSSYEQRLSPLAPAAHKTSAVPLKLPLPLLLGLLTRLARSSALVFVLLVFSWLAKVLFLGQVVHNMLAFIQAWRQGALWAAFSHFVRFWDLCRFRSRFSRLRSTPSWFVFSFSVFDRQHVYGAFSFIRAFMDLLGFVYGVARLHVLWSYGVSFTCLFVGDFDSG